MSEFLTLQNISKSFAEKEVVNIEHLTFKQSEIIGFLGPNGAGKTTTIRMIMQIIQPDQGEILFNGHPLNEKDMAFIGYLPEERGLFKKNKVGDTIKFFGKLKGKSNSYINKKMDEYLELFQLTDYKNKKIEELSRGMQQKLQFIITIIHDPQLIILDEPFTGLDPINVEILLNIIKEERQKGKTIIFSTHMMEKAEQICKNIILINKGKILINENIKTLRDKFSTNEYEIECDSSIEELEKLNFIKHIYKKNHKYIIVFDEKLDSKEALKKLIDATTNIKSFNLHRPSLYDIFLKVVEKGEQL